MNKLSLCTILCQEGTYLVYFKLNIVEHGSECSVKVKFVHGVFLFFLLLVSLVLCTPQMFFYEAIL